MAGETTAIRGTASELVRALPAAEGPSAALLAGWTEFEQAPALTKRRVLTACSAITGAGEHGGSENINGEGS
jgi:hypothetical protein